MSHESHRHSEPPHSREATDGMVRDEVCGMRIAASKVAETTVFEGNTYYFCSTRCRDRFLEHPGWYVAVRPSAADDTTPGDR